MRRTIHLSGKTLFLTKRKHAGNGLSKRRGGVMSGGDVLLKSMVSGVSGVSKRKHKSPFVVSKGGSIYNESVSMKPTHRLGKLNSKPIKLLL